MVDVCGLVGKLPEPVERLVVATAARRYLEYLISNKMYEEAAKFLVSYGDKLGIPTPELRRLKDILEFNAAVRRANNVVEALMEFVQRLEPIPDHLKREAREAAERLLHSLSAYIPASAREAAKKVIELLEDVDNIDRMIRMRKVVEAYEAEIKRLFEEMKRVANREAEAARRGDYEAARKLHERMVELYREAQRLASRLEEFMGTVRGFECRSDVCRRVREAILGAATKLLGFLKAAPLLLMVYSEVVWRLIHAAREVEDAFRKLESVDNPLKALDEFREAVYAVAALKKSLSRYLQLVREAGGIAARYGASDLVDKLQRMIERFVEAEAKGIVYRLEDALVKAAAHNDDMWEALEKAYRDVGLAVPDRPSVPPHESVMDFVKTWLARFDFEQEVYARAAENARNVFELLSAAAMATLTAFAKHVVGMLAAIPEFVREAAAETIRDLQMLAGGRLKEAVEHRLEFLRKTIESMIPHPKNIYDAIGFLAAVASLGYLLGEAGVPVPRGLARIPVLRTLLGDKLTVFSVIDLVAPEIGLVLRAGSEALSRAMDRVAEELREIAARIRSGNVRAVLVELGKRLADLEIRSESVGEMLETMKRALEERLAKYIGRREAARVAAKILEDIAARLKGKPRLSDVLEAVEEVAEKEGPVLAASVIEDVAGVKSMRDVLRRGLDEAIYKLYTAETLSELAEALARLKEVYNEAATVLQRLREVRGFLERIGARSVVRLIDELERRLEEGDLSVLSKAEEVLRAATGLMSRLDEVKRTMADLVLRLTGDRAAAEAIMRAEKPIDAVKMALDAILRESKSPLEALDRFIETLDRLWAQLEPLLARLAKDLAGAFRAELEQVVGPSLAKKPIIGVESLPEELRRLLEYAGVRKARLSLEDLAVVLERLAKKVPDMSLETLQALSSVLGKLRELVEEARDVATRIERRDLALRIERAYKVLGDEVRRRLEYILETYKPLIESLREAARLAEEAGVREAAELLERAVGVLPRAEEAYKLIVEALKLLRRAAKEPILKRIAEVLKRGVESRKSLLGHFARDILEMIREIEEAGGYVVRVGVHEVKALRALDAEAAEALAREITRGRWSETVRIGPYEFRVERSVRFRPNRVVYEWRVEAPGGYWLRVREIIDVVCKGGECYAKTARIVAYDPRLEGNPEALSLLEYAAARAIRDDPLSKIGERIVVLMEGGGRELLARLLEGLADMLEERAGSIPRLVESLKTAIPLYALHAVLPLIDEVGKSITIGGVTRRIVLEPTRLLIIYSRGGRLAKIAITPEGVKVEGDVSVLIEGVRFDEEVREVLRQLLKVKPPTPEEIEKFSVKVIPYDSRKIHIVPGDVLAKILSFILANPNTGNVVKVKIGNLVIPVVKYKYGGTTITVALTPPEAVQVPIQAPQQPPPPPPGGRAAAAPSMPMPTLSLMLTGAARVKRGRPVAEQLVL